MERLALYRKIIAEIEAWDPIRGESQWTDERFERLAREIFAYQYAGNEAYRRYCDGKGVTPKNLVSYREMPGVPTDVFKHVRLFAGETSTKVFRTSGTTLDLRGEHHFATLDVYRAAIHGPFRRFCMPETQKMRMLVLAPSGEDLPDSSLSFMLSELVAQRGSEQSAFFVRREGDTLTLALEALEEALVDAEAHGEPVMLLGTAFAFVEFFDFSRRDFVLAPGSRLMETGGLKGRTREVSREELYAMFQARLGLSLEHCISEYSMTELSSQAYTDNFREKSSNITRWCVPPWVRVEIVDPLTLKPVGTAGEKGLIRWIDLANVDSVCVVQTSDLGVADGRGGFSLLGRAPGAQLRGCSLTIEEIVKSG